MKEVSTHKKYFGKVLLFGEHNVLYGGQGFALPLNQFFGRWAFDTNRKAFDTALIDYLESQSFQGTTFLSEKFKHQCRKGLFFDSNIKSGYGTGSSGAITAALYDTFFTKKSYGLEETKHNLATIERFFQGTSSGIDPTVIFFNAAITLSSIHIDIEEKHNFDRLNSQFYLVDSEQKRSTSKMIELFKKAIADDSGSLLLEQLISHSDHCINFLTKSLDQSAFDHHMKRISEIQLLLANELIPNHMKAYWRHGLENDKYYMKLCGAGGGGFFLLYSRDKVEINAIPDHLLVPIG